jgi:hypothetical protein
MSGIFDSTAGSISERDTDTDVDVVNSTPDEVYPMVGSFFGKKAQVPEKADAARFSMQNVVKRHKKLSQRRDGVDTLMYSHWLGFVAPRSAASERPDSRDSTVFGKAIAIGAEGINNNFMACNLNVVSNSAPNSSQNQSQSQSRSIETSMSRTITIVSPVTIENELVRVFTLV